MKYSKEDVQNATNALKRVFDEQKSIVITVKSVAKSGMSRTMKVYSRDLNTNLTYWASVILGQSLLNDGSIRIGGCGMDMTFHLAYTLTHRVYGRDNLPEWLTGNGGDCIDWKVI